MHISLYVIRSFFGKAYIETGKPNNPKDLLVRSTTRIVLGLSVLAIGTLVAEMGGPQWIKVTIVIVVSAIGLTSVCLIGCAAEVDNLWKPIDAYVRWSIKIEHRILPEWITNSEISQWTNEKWPSRIMTLSTLLEFIVIIFGYYVFHRIGII